MKYLTYCFVFLACILIFGCEKEKITDWESIVPGQYTGDISISTDLESRLAPSGQQTLYSYKTKSSFATTADVTYNGYGFIISFEENEIIGKEVVGVYIITSEHTHAKLGLSHSQGISKKPKGLLYNFYSPYGGGSDGIIFQENILSISVSYTYHYQTDSAISISFDGRKSLE